MRAAIFDVDRTLLDGMSGYLFAKHLWRTGAMPWAGRARSALAIARYRLGLADVMAIVEAGVSCCAGLNAGDVERLADEAVAATMRPRIYQEALSAIAERRARGELTLLATGSNGFVARALARAVGAHDGIGTEGRRVGERLTAEMILPACVGEGKKTLVLAWLAAHGVEPENATAYTDNGIDIPLLDAVGEAIAVNADAELAAYATRRGLRVERWVTPLDSNHRRSGESWPLKLEVDE